MLPRDRPELSNLLLGLHFHTTHLDDCLDYLFFCEKIKENGMEGEYSYPLTCQLDSWDGFLHLHYRNPCNVHDSRNDVFEPKILDSILLITVSASLLPIAILAIGSDKTELECLFFLQFITGFRNFDIVSCGVILTEILAGSLDLFIVLSVNTRIFMISNCNLRFDALQIVQLTKGTMIVSFALAVTQILCIVLAKKMVDIPNEFFKNFGPFPLSIVLYLPLLQVCVLLFILRKRNPKVDGKVDPINETKRMWKHGPKTTGNNSLFFTNCSPTPVSVF
ncbi:hypothetical protein CRE_22433 [Caenorhabditis remanei]|uniref:Uncharacterized protein n=1 Tax=Caenorhabditis remanei TaxID=31234 RepID=E3ME51_CAERE|nr:hypothetical protein CRE_22433 [Caenorhabditis remanei]